MSTSREKRPILAHTGLYLVHNAKSKPSDSASSHTLYRIAAVGAALFLVFSTC
jgi:hypothetical protein